MSAAVEAQAGSGLAPGYKYSVASEGVYGVGAHADAGAESEDRNGATL